MVDSKYVYSVKLVKEHIDFKRGIEPNDSMQTGDIYERNKKTLIQFFKKISRNVSYAEEPIEILGDDIKFLEFEISLRQNKIRYYIKYYRDEGDKDTFTIGWEMGSKGNYDGDEVTYNTIEEAIQQIKAWTAIKESVGFERHIEPKESMRTGNRYQQIHDKCYNLLEEIIEENKIEAAIEDKSSKPSEDIWEIYMFFAVLGGVEYGITYRNTDVRETQLAIFWRTEGIYGVKNEEGRVVNSFKEAKKELTKILSNVRTYESNFQRNIEPKKSMGTGIVSIKVDTVASIDKHGKIIPFPEDDQPADEFIKFLNDHHITYKVISKNGGSGGYPFIKYTGSREDLALMLAIHFDEDISEFKIYK